MLLEFTPVLMHIIQENQIKLHVQNTKRVFFFTCFNQEEIRREKWLFAFHIGNTTLWNVKRENQHQHFLIKLRIRVNSGKFTSERRDSRRLEDNSMISHFCSCSAEHRIFFLYPISTVSYFSWLVFSHYYSSCEANIFRVRGSYHRTWTETLKMMFQQLRTDKKFS